MDWCEEGDEVCDDQCDNDGDGDIDCDDSDCAAEPDCQDPAPCNGQTDGDYCGSNLGGLATHGSLYTCQGGQTASEIACASGCANGDCNPVASDPCASATSNSGCSTGPHIHLETVSVPAGTGAYLSTCNSVNPTTLYCP